MEVKLNNAIVLSGIEERGYTNKENVLSDISNGVQKCYLLNKDLARCTDNLVHIKGTENKKDNP